MAPYDSAWLRAASDDGEDLYVITPEAVAATELSRSAHRVGVRVAMRLRIGSRAMQHFRLTHPALSFYVDVTVHERDGRCMATADLAEDSRDVGLGSTGQESRQGRADGAWRAVREREAESSRPDERQASVHAGPGHRLVEGVGVALVDRAVRAL